MQHALALELGMTVEDLRETMTASAFYRWMAFFKVREEKRVERRS